MLKRLTIPGIEIPRLYIAENKEDADAAMSKGIPFVKWRHGEDELIKTLLMPTLKKMFPHIKWDEMSGIPRSRSVLVKVPGSKTNGTIELDGSSASNDHYSGSSHTPDDDIDVLVEYAEDYREFSGDGSKCMSYEEVKLAVHIGDISSQVNLDVLQNLKLMPKFIGDILDCIKTNTVAGTLWTEGYNKKLGATVGNYSRANEMRNLIIVDVSASIPVGISSTMITLLDTLRTQVHADLIVTGGKSRFYAYEDELPSPQVIRNTIPRCNEAFEFYQILRDHVAGHHYNHVVSFGDNDCPASFCSIVNAPSLAGTIVEEVHHYHTYLNEPTGYALWTNDLPKKPKFTVDKSWCNMIKK